jgi:hypothetical protein
MRTSIRLFGAAALVFGLLMAGVPLAASAQAQNVTNGRNVVRVMVDAGPDGQYAMEANGRWVELDTRGRRIFTFRETMRDDWSVYLFDDTRRTEIQLDLHRRKVLISQNGGPRTDLYNIVRASRVQGGYTDDYRPRPKPTPFPPPPPPRPTPAIAVFSVEAGPIWSQAHAEQRCREIAGLTRGDWTGGWWTTVPNKMSVCEIRWR